MLERGDIFGREDKLFLVPMVLAAWGQVTVAAEGSSANACAGLLDGVVGGPGSSSDTSFCGVVLCLLAVDLIAVGREMRNISCELGKDQESGFLVRTNRNYLIILSTVLSVDGKKYIYNHLSVMSGSCGCGYTR